MNDKINFITQKHKETGPAVVILHPDTKIEDITQFKRDLAEYNYSMIIVTKNEIETLGIMCGELNFNKVFNPKNAYIVSLDGELFKGKHPYDITNFK